MVMPKSHSFAVLSVESMSTCERVTAGRWREKRSADVVALHVAMNECGPGAVHKLEPKVTNQSAVRFVPDAAQRTCSARAMPMAVRT